MRSRVVETRKGATMNAATKPEATVTTTKGVTTYTNIQSRNYKRQGTTYPGEVRDGHHVEVKPGEYVRVYGVRKNRCHYLTVYNTDGSKKFVVTHYDEPYDLIFHLGDDAEYDSYNLKYTGPIVAIGAKTITIKGMSGRKRLALHEFSWRNEDYDAEKIASDNATTMMTI